MGHAGGRSRAAECVADVRKRLANAVDPAGLGTVYRGGALRAGHRRGRPLVQGALAGGLRILAAIWVVLVIGRYEDVTARSLYGRDINLYWDARNLPSVGGMLSSVAKPWLVAATIAGVSRVPLIIYLPLRWALGCVTNASKDPRVRNVLTAVAGAVLVVGVAQGLGVLCPVACTS